MEIQAKNHDQIESQYLKILGAYTIDQKALQTKSQAIVHNAQEQSLQTMSDLTPTSAAELVENMRVKMEYTLTEVMTLFDDVSLYKQDLQTALALQRQQLELLVKVGVVSEMIGLTAQKHADSVKRVKEVSQARMDELDSTIVRETEAFAARMSNDEVRFEQSQEKIQQGYANALKALEYNASRRKIETEDAHKKAIHELNKELDIQEASLRGEWSTKEQFLKEHAEQREHLEQTQSTLEVELQERTRAVRESAYAEELKKISLEKDLLEQEFDNRKIGHEQQIQSLTTQEASNATQIQQLQNMVQEAFAKLQELSVTAIQ
jgi:hypothetical protein